MQVSGSEILSKLLCFVVLFLEFADGQFSEALKLYVELFPRITTDIGYEGRPIAVADCRRR